MLSRQLAYQCWCTEITFGEGAIAQDLAACQDAPILVQVFGIVLKIIVGILVDNRTYVHLPFSRITHFQLFRLGDQAFNQLIVDRVFDKYT